MFRDFTYIDDVVENLYRLVKNQQNLIKNSIYPNQFRLLVGRPIKYLILEIVNQLNLLNLLIALEVLDKKALKDICQCKTVM